MADPGLLRLAELEDEMRAETSARLVWAVSNLAPGDPAITDALLAAALLDSA